MATLAVLVAMLAVVFVGVFVMLAVVFGMFALPTRESAVAAKVLRGATRRVTGKRMAGRNPLASNKDQTAGGQGPDLKRIRPERR